MKNGVYIFWMVVAFAMILVVLLSRYSWDYNWLVGIIGVVIFWVTAVNYHKSKTEVVQDDM